MKKMLKKEKKKKKTVLVGSTGRSLGATGCRIGFAPAT
jgi:aspartate/methionine/tyrosine aminotransferase